MKLNVIREFLRLCETKNYTRTAEELYISQSVLSRHIAALEEELGVQLINRSRSAFELSEAGEIAKQSFEKMILEYQDLLGSLSALNESGEGELHAGALYYDYSQYIANIRGTFHDHYPQISLQFHSYQPEQIEQDLLNGKIDIAFLYGVRSTKRKDVRLMPFLKVPVCVMCDASHRLSALKEIRVSDLDNEKILWPSSHLELSNTAEIINGIFEKNHIRMREYIPFTNFDDVPYLLKSTGAVFLSPMANTSAYPAGTVCRDLQSGECAMDISAVWRKDCTNPAIRALLNAVRITYP